MLEAHRENIYHCLKCGACRIGFPSYEPVCPSGIKFGFDSHYAIGRVEIARRLCEGELALTAKLMERLYTCTSCGGCDAQCDPAVGIGPLAIIEGIKAEAVEAGRLPAPVRKFLESMQTRGNPFKKAPKYRDQWAEGMDIPRFDGHDTLFYVGCVGAFDERGQQVARAAAKLLGAAGTSFGILGPKETCDGNEVNKVGECDLFREMALANIALFHNHGVRQVVTLSPHGFNAFKNDYPALGARFETQHISQFLWSLIDTGRIGSLQAKPQRVTFHDPCLLGRHNGEYEAPRRILSAIAGINLLEMPRNGKNALCCGGGGANFFTDMLGGGERSPARIRVREAVATGADVLATACPTCAKMFTDAVKAEWLEDKLQIKDICEIVLDAMAPMT